MGETPQELKIQPGKQNVLMMIGIQGSGKTTHSSKTGTILPEKRLKVGVICADTFRPGAYNQLKQLAESIKVPFYGEPDEKDPVALSRARCRTLQGH